MKKIYITCLIISVLLTACSPKKTDPNSGSSSASIEQISESDNLTTSKDNPIQVTETQEIPKQQDLENQESKKESTQPNNNPIYNNQQKANKSVPTKKSDSNSNKPIQRNIPLLYPTGDFVQSDNLVISVASIPDPDVSVEELYVWDLTTKEQLFSDTNYRGQSSIKVTVPNTTYFNNSGRGYSGRTLREGHQIQIVIQAWTFSNKYIYKGVHTFTVNNFAVKPLSVVSPPNNSIVNGSQATILKVSAPDMLMRFKTIVYDADSSLCVIRFDDALRDHDLAPFIKPGHNYLVHVTCYGYNDTPSTTTESRFSVTN